MHLLNKVATLACKKASLKKDSAIREVAISDQRYKSYYCYGYAMHTSFKA